MGRKPNNPPESETPEIKEEEVVIDKVLEDTEIKKVVANKMKALKDVLLGIDKKYGEGTIMEIGRISHY